MLKCLIVLVALQATFEGANAAAAPATPGFAAHSLAVLDPVDLITRKPDSAWGNFLRGRFAAQPDWKVIGRDSMSAKDKAYSFSAYRDCHEFQCAFDAGNIFPAEYVLFTSLTRLDGIYAYTMNLLHVPTSRTLWSGTGQAGPGRSGDPRLALEAAWTRRVGRFQSGKVPQGAKARLGHITVLDLSPGHWAPAQVIAERAATHLTASGVFDIMGGREQDELVDALVIDRAGFIPSDTALIGLGRRMGVTHMVSSRLMEDRREGIRLELAYYDIAKGRKVKAGRSGFTPNPVDYLRFETEFFSSRFGIERDAEDGLEGPGGRRGRAWLAAAGGVAAGAVGIAGGWLAYRFDRDSRAKYGRIGESRSRETAQALRGDAAALESRSRIWGGVGVAGLMAGAALIVVAF